MYRPGAAAYRTTCRGVGCVRLSSQREDLELGAPIHQDWIWTAESRRQSANDPREPERNVRQNAWLFLQTLPITRVKKIIKQDGEVKAISNDANYVIAKAAVSCACRPSSSVQLPLYSCTSHQSRSNTKT